MTANNQHYIGADAVNPEAVANAGSKPLQRPEPLCRIDELAYVLFERPDLDKQRDFLVDFGMRVAGEDVPMPYAANLEKLALPQPDDIVAAAKAACYR